MVFIYWSSVPLVGRTLSNYRIVEKLGAGGMGEVYAAEDTRLKRTVALKVLAPAYASHPERLARFQREAEAVAALNHPNIVVIHSVEEAEGIRFLTMELVAGKPLSKLIFPGGLALAQLFEIAVPLVDAVAAAHEKGIVHRDLKPDNIMLNERGAVKVLDFGLAKLRGKASAQAASGDTTETLAHDGRIIGTLAYMSPEQLRGQSVNHQTDVFSLGVILHEMATGKPPFQGKSSMDIASAILTQEPPAVTDVRDDLPFHLGRIIRHCLAKDPAHRYQATQDLREDLAELAQEVAAGRVRTSTLSSDSLRVSTGKSSRRWWLAGAAVLAVMASVFLGVRFRQSRVPRGFDVIAVLPFANMTGDPNQDYLAEGLAAGLITQLSSVQGLSVIGRSETWSYRDRGLSPTEMGRELGIAGFVEGELHATPEGLRADIGLADAQTGVVVWSHSYTADRARIVSMQQEVARDLARFASIPLSRKERSRLAKKPTLSPRAYDFYLQAQQFLEAVDNPRGPEFARDLYLQAVRLDPEFALAEVGLSEAQLKLHERTKDPDALAEAESRARRALDLDAELPAAILAMAKVHRASGRYAESLAELRPLLVNHPRPDEAHRELAFSYEQAGDLKAAERSLRSAVALRSDHWHHWNSLGGFLVRKGDYPEARAAFAEAVSLAPSGVGGPLWNLIAVRLREGDWEGAIEDFEALEGPLEDARLASNMGTAYFFVNRLEDAETYYKLALSLEPQDPLKHGNLADLYLRRGRRAEAQAEYSTAMRLVAEALLNSPNSNELRISQALYAAKAGECSTASGLALRLKTDLPATGQNVHDRALVHALCDELDEALAAIRAAVSLGVSGKLIRQEDEFAPLREDAEFLALTGAGAENSDGARP
ncbi:MAG: protein kinase [Acidobacteria bacterium]|nr:protein kinase [Acidobacteriota bacterium]